MNIILLAPPAAGKGTQAEILIEKYHFSQISTGDLFREIASSNTDLGNTIQQILARGELVSDEITLQIIESYLDNHPNPHGYIFDGFPRNSLQAQKLDSMLASRQEKIDYVFYLEVEKDILLNRISGRRVCKNCGKVYNIHIDSLKPKTDSICDKCGCELYQREDDNMISFEVRYQTYLDSTKPLIDYYQKQNVLYPIDSSGDKENTLRQIESIIEKR